MDKAESEYDTLYMVEMVRNWTYKIVLRRILHSVHILCSYSFMCKQLHYNDDDDEKVTLVVRCVM